MKQTRFKYAGSWTRWFGPDEDLSIMRTIDIEAMEVVETMPREQAIQYLKEIADSSSTPTDKT